MRPDSLQNRLVQISKDLNSLTKIEQAKGNGYFIATVQDGVLQEAVAFPYTWDGLSRFVWHWITEFSPFSSKKTYATIAGVKEQLLLDMRREIAKVTEEFQQLPEWNPQKEVAIISEANIYTQKVNAVASLSGKLTNLLGSFKDDDLKADLSKELDKLNANLSTRKMEVGDKLQKSIDKISGELNKAEQDPKILKRTKAYEKYTPVIFEMMKFQKKLNDKIKLDGSDSLSQFQKNVESLFLPAQNAYDRLKNKVLLDSVSRFNHHKIKALKRLAPYAEMDLYNLIAKAIEFDSIPINHRDSYKESMYELADRLHINPFKNDGTLAYDRLQIMLQRNLSQLIEKKQAVTDVKKDLERRLLALNKEEDVQAKVVNLEELQQVKTFMSPRNEKEKSELEDDSKWHSMDAPYQDIIEKLQEPITETKILSTEEIKQETEHQEKDLEKIQLLKSALADVERQEKELQPQIRALRSANAVLMKLAVR